MAEGGGWRARLAAKEAAGLLGGKKCQGIVLRVSSTGFGFVGEHTTTRKRIYFQFKDVVDKRHAELKTGTRVEYEVRTNDDTMESEAFNVRVIDGQTDGSGGTATAWKSQNRSNNNRINLRESNSSLKTWAASGGGKNAQKTAQKYNHVGAKDQAGGITGKSLMGIIGLDGDGEGVGTIAKSHEDYDHNPTGGNGFSREYQLRRGVKPEDIQVLSDEKPLAQGDPPVHATPIGKGRCVGQRGPTVGRKGRSLAELAAASGDSSATRTNTRATRKW